MHLYRKRAGAKPARNSFGHSLPLLVMSQKHTNEHAVSLHPSILNLANTYIKS